MSELALGARMLAALAVIALVLFGLQVLVRLTRDRRVGSRSHGRLIEVLETVFLPNAASVHALKIGERCIIVGRASTHIALLCELSPQHVEAWLAARPRSLLPPVAPFLGLLRGRRKKRA